MTVITIITIILFFFCSLPFLTGIGVLILSKVNQKDWSSTPILVCHSVTTQRNRLGYSQLDITTFNNFLTHLFHNGYQSKTICELTQESENSIFSLTFDDGFEDLYTFVLPILQHYNFRVTLFPITQYIGSLSTWDVFHPIKHLSKEQIRILHDSGNEIGSHTHTHPDCTRLCTKELIHEFKTSKKILENITGSSIHSIAFPYGLWNKRIWQIAQECGYTHATAYHYQNKTFFPIFPAIGCYNFDTADDLCEKVYNYNSPSLILKRSAIMSHFAKGSSLWMFRKTYYLNRK